MSYTAKTIEIEPERIEALLVILDTVSEAAKQNPGEAALSTATIDLDALRARLRAVGTSYATRFDRPIDDAGSWLRLAGEWTSTVEAQIGEKIAEIRAAHPRIGIDVRARPAARVVVSSHGSFGLDAETKRTADECREALRFAKFPRNADGGLRADWVEAEVVDRMYCG